MSVLLVVSWLVFGLIVGLVARVLYPGAQAMGLFATALLGIAGSFVGGLLGNFVAGTTPLAVHAAGLFGSILGTLVVLAVLGLSQRRARA